MCLFAVQVDNPVVMLNQEASKEFLSSKTPHDMYRLFLKATQLDVVKSEFRQAEESQKVAVSELKSREKVLRIMETNVTKWAQKYRACVSLSKLYEKIETLKQEMAWAFVCEKEKTVEGLVKELSTLEVQTPKFVQKVEASQKKVEAKESERVRIEDELKAARDEVAELEPKLTGTKLQFLAEKQAAVSAADDLRQIESELRRTVADRRQVVKRTDDIRTSDYAAVRSERERNIARLESQAKDHAANCRTVESSASQLKQAVRAEQEAVAELRAEERELRRKHDAADKKLRELQSSRRNSLRRFATWMPELVRKIDDAHRNGRFHAKPRGPIGANIKLRDPRWALAVERCLGPGLLNAFCVNDYHDEKVFEEIS